MYTILVRPDDTLIATSRENIYHRTSLVRNLRFLVDPLYNDGNETLDMRTYICTLEYKTPISNTYVPVILTPSVDLYKEKVEYILPVDTAITSEVGNVEMKLTWVKLEMDNDGNFKERVRKTSATEVEILPVAQWSDYIADSKLDNIAQILLSNQAQTEQMKVYVEQIQQLTQYNTLSKADNVIYDELSGELQLTSMGNPIGDKVTISGEGSYDEEGIPAVDFTTVEPDDGDTEVDNVVEFQ